MTPGTDHGRGPTRKLSGWVAALRYHDLPTRTREVVRVLLLDTLGCGVCGVCGVCGYGTQWAGIVLDRVRVDVLDPLGSPARPVDTAGVIEKFRGIDPQLPVDRIADTALGIERSTVKDLIALLAGATPRQLRTP